jgi:hypothetical protein
VNRDLSDPFIDMKSLAGELDIPQATLYGLLPDSIRAIMETDGTGNRVRYHRRYIPAIRAMLDEVDGSGKRVVKPKTAHLFLAPRIEAINRGEKLDEVLGEAGLKRGSGEIMNRETQNAIHDVPDPAERALVALEKLASLGIVATLPDKLLTRDEAMEEFGVSESSLKLLPHAREGKFQKWNRSTVAAYVASKAAALKS